MALKKYKALIDCFPLIPIKGDAHLELAHEMAKSLMLRTKPLAEEESDYLEVLVDQIAKYEKKFHALKISELAPHDLLRSFMEDHNLKQVDLQKILGVNSSGTVSEIVAGKRELSKEHCIKLGDYFKVSPAAFLPKILA